MIANYEVQSDEQTITTLSVENADRELELLLGSIFYRDKEIKSGFASCLRFSSQKNPARNFSHLFNDHHLLIYNYAGKHIDEVIGVIQHHFEPGSINTSPITHFIGRHPEYKEAHILVGYEYKKPIVCIIDGDGSFYTQEFDLSEG